MQIWIQLFTSMRVRIRIQGAKTMQIHAYSDPGQTLLSQKVEKVGFWHEKIIPVLCLCRYYVIKLTYAGTKAGNQIYLLICLISLLLDPDPHSNRDPDSGEQSH